MANDAINIDEQLSVLEETKSLLKQAIIDKGQEVLDTDSFRSYVEKVSNITTGIDTSDANAIANDIVEDKTAYVNGEKVTGTIPIITTNPNGASIMYADKVQNIGNAQLQFVTKNIGIRQILDINSNIAIRASNINIADVIGLTADKIIEGNTILGIEGTGKTSEDLQEQLDAQDTIIEELQASLDNKASSTDIKPNVFMQETEPTTKDGIWLKGNYQVGNIVADENIFAGEEWNTTKMSSLKEIPYGFYNSSAVAIGTNVYLFGGTFEGTTTYKYDTLTDTYTTLTDIPYEFRSGSAVAIGTDIYLLGGSGDNIQFYKYNTLTGTYTKLKNIPYGFYRGSAVAIGTDIYLLGGYNSNITAYKYNTLTGTYTKLTDIPYNFYDGSAVAIGTNVYLFCRTTTYKYDTLTDTYTQLTNIPYGFDSGSAVAIGTDIYLFGGERHNTKVQVMTMILNDYSNNSIVILQGTPSHKTNIANYGIQNAKFYYDKVYYQDENGELLNTIPTYNGNGTEWVKISGGEG